MNLEVKLPQDNR